MCLLSVFVGVNFEYKFGATTKTHSMKTKLLSLITLILFAFNSDIVIGQQTGVWTKTITWGSGTRKEVFNVPASYNASKKYKLIIGLHGLNGDPTYYMSFFGPMTGSNGIPDKSNNLCNSHVWTGVSPVQDNFIIVCPQAVGTNTDFWTPVGDTALITKAISDAMSMYNIDPEYIYLNGESLGGRAALRYGLLNWKRFRGLILWVPAIQSMNEANNLATFNYAYQNAPHIPICFQIATLDGLMYNDTRAYWQCKNAGGITFLQMMDTYCHAPSPDDYTFNAIANIDKNATSFKNNDAGIYAIQKPLGEECSTTFTPQVTIQNKGNGNLTSVTINFQIDNGTVNTMSWTGTLGQLSRAKITLPSQTTTAGAHTFKVYTTQPNGVADAVPVNDQITLSFNCISTGTGASFTENFEGQKQKNSGIFPTDWRAPAGWRQMGPDSAAYWELDTIFGKGGTCMNFDNAAHNNTGKRYRMCTRAFDFSGVTSSVLAYDYAYSPITLGGVLKTDTLAVSYSTDCGSTWTTLFSKGGVALNTGSPTWGTKETGNFFFPTSSDWKSESINLNSLAGKPNVMLAFEARSQYGNWMFLDNISLSSATGTNEGPQQNGISIFPNPSAGEFIVDGLQSEGQIEIYNTNGQKVFDEIVSGKLTSVKLDQGSGIYFVKISTAEGEARRKIVIAK